MENVRSIHILACIALIVFNSMVLSGHIPCDYLFPINIAGSVVGFAGSAFIAKKYFISWLNNMEIESAGSGRKLNPHDTGSGETEECVRKRDLANAIMNKTVAFSALFFGAMLAINIVGIFQLIPADYAAIGNLTLTGLSILPLMYVHKKLDNLRYGNGYF